MNENRILRWLALAAIVFGAFDVHVMGSGAYEMRTVGAMTVRSLFWIALAMVSLRAVKRVPDARPEA